MGSLRQGEESSFFEQKEAKTLYQFSRLRSLAGQVGSQSDKSFLLLFFKKEDSSTSARRWLAAWLESAGG